MFVSEKPNVPKLNAPLLEEPVIVAERIAELNVCAADHVFAWPSASDAITAPAVGLIVNVPSLFETDETAPVEIVLQPKPDPLVHVSAFEAPEQDGTASADGDVAVSAPRTVLALIDARFVAR